MNQNEDCLVCTWTKSYLINLHCVYSYITYIIYKNYIFSISVVALFGWLVIWRKDILSIESRLFDVTFSIYYFIYVRPTVWEKRNKIDVLSEEPYPLRRGGATGRANRLMMCDDRDDDARDGPALRSSGTRLVSEVSRVTERAAWHWDVHLPPPIYHHTTTRAQ